MKLHIAKPEELEINNRITTPSLLVSSIESYTNTRCSYLVTTDEFDMVCQDIQEHYNSSGNTMDDIRRCIFKINAVYDKIELNTEFYFEVNDSITTFAFDEDRIIMARDYFNCLMEVL